MIKKSLKSVTILSILLLFMSCGAKNCGCGLTSEADTKKQLEKTTSITFKKTETAK